MNRQFRSVCIGMFVLFLTLSQPPGAAITAQPGTSEPVSKESCLGCHGPFDKLADASAGYVSPSGEKITPHRYVPHVSKEVKAIPECTNCHQPHPESLTAADLAALAKPSVEWCFSCHHENNFELCKHCHK